MPQRFHPFSAQHGITVLIGVIIIAAILTAGRKSARGKRITSAILIFITLGIYPLGQIAWLFNGSNVSLENRLPFHLCDLAALIAGAALLKKNRTLCELTYFWGLAASIQGLLTPAVGYGFPSPVFIAFFVHHFVIVGIALYLPVVHGWRPCSPWWQSPLRAFGWANVYLVMAYALNLLLGTNFGFFMAKPENPSLLDHFGPWPWYILGMEALAIVFFLLLMLPFAHRGNKLASSSDAAIPPP